MEIVTALLIPLLGTMMGASFVFFMKDAMPLRVQKALLGFASGVMVAASVWSLLLPSMDMGGGVWPAALGLLGGFAFLLLIDHLTPHIHPGGEEEGPHSRISRTAKLALASTRRSISWHLTLAPPAISAPSGNINEALR